MSSRARKTEASSSDGTRSLNRRHNSCRRCSSPGPSRPMLSTPYPSHGAARSPEDCCADMSGLQRPLYTAPAVVDSRIERLAELLVERCLDVQPGGQVLVMGHPPARPLLEEVCRQIGRRGAYALLRLRIDNPPLRAWMLEADEALIAEFPEIDAHGYTHMDSYMVVEAPENTRTGSEVPAERTRLRSKATRPYMERVFTGEMRWVGLDFPTQGIAQDAGMTLSQFEDFYWGALLIDWEALGDKMRRIADRFD